jgi:hypothetical protein
LTLPLIPVACSKAAALVLLAGAAARAHDVPAITVEAVMSEGSGELSLTVNFDPRLFLSEDPRALPPVPVEWFTSMTPDEKAGAQARAANYLDAALTQSFGRDEVALPGWKLQAVDGQTGRALPETGPQPEGELHFAATLEQPLPPATKGWTLRSTATARAPVILLTGIDPDPKRTPQILFPGETSTPLKPPAGSR